jgi:hypothetical protein
MVASDSVSGPPPVTSSKRGCRHPNSDPLLRTVRVIAYMTRNERCRIGERAKARGIGISTHMLRSALMQKAPPAKPPAPPIPEVSRHTYSQLAQLGNSLNQLARWANIGGDEAPSAAQVLDTLDALMLVVYHVKLELVGGGMDRRNEEP